MKQWVCILTSVMLLSIMWTGVSYAQPKAVSSIWSFNGIGFGYEHRVDNDSFIEADLRAEMTEVFINMKGKVGLTASLTWNMIFARQESGNGNSISWFAGPGAIAGIANDYKASTGGLFGFRCRIGVECIFDRNIALSACLAPTLGMHVSRDGNITNMRLYRYGLIYGFMPEIGIKYMF